jgi:imidazolonepropionase-like amidohydrolase
VLVKGARVFDGSRVLPRTDVLVRNGSIAEVGPNLTPPAGAEVVDGQGKTLLPGFIDAHTHTFGNALRDALGFGTTTVLDQFTDPQMAAGLKKRQSAGELADQADIFSAGVLVTAPRGHGTEYGLVIPVISSPDSAQAFVDARLADGSDWIKIVYDNGRGFGGSIPTLDLPTLRAVIGATHKRGKLAVVHISDQKAAREAIEAGADGLVHLFADSAPDSGFAALVKQRGAFIIPTLTVVESVTGTASGKPLLDDARVAPGLSGDASANLGRAFPFRPSSPSRFSHAVETVRQLRARGVPILAGTDAPNPGTWQGVSMHRELELLVNAGLTPVEALTSATSLPARHFRLGDRGRIAKGLRADLVLVNGDPTTDIMATRDVVAIWKRGVKLDRPAFLATAARERAAMTSASSAAAPTGLISDFEEGSTPLSKFGAGWMISTDAMMGGKSKATMAVVDGGASGSAKSLAVEGTIEEGRAQAWAGVMFFPGKQPMQPANLSASREIAFRAKGDGRTYTIMLFAQSKGMQPIMRTFVAGPEWTEHTFRFTDFDGVDGKDVMGVVFAAGPGAPAFTFRLDDVRLR